MLSKEQWSFVLETHGTQYVDIVETGMRQTP